MPNDAQSFNIDFNYLVQPAVGPHSCCASALRQVGTLLVGRKVPQLFPATGATKWDDPKGHHWTMGFFVS